MTERITTDSLWREMARLVTLLDQPSLAIYPHESDSAEEELLQSDIYIRWKGVFKNTRVAFETRGYLPEPPYPADLSDDPRFRGDTVQRAYEIINKQEREPMALDETERQLFYECAMGAGYISMSCLKPETDCSANYIHIARRGDEPIELARINLHLAVLTEQDEPYHYEWVERTIAQVRADQQQKPFNWL